MEFKNFDASTVRLRWDLNLIEASAGTGKTYSIAIPVLVVTITSNGFVKRKY